MANAWYSYNGTGDVTSAASYNKLSGKPLGCLSGTIVCAIYAPGGGIFPLAPLPSNILNYICDGLSTQVPQPQVPVGTKYFVYMRS